MHCVWSGRAASNSPSEVYRLSDEGVLYCGYREIDEYQVWETPASPTLELKFGVKKGDSWTSKRFDNEVSYEHAGEVEVEVPAGTYKAIKIVQTCTEGK